MVSETIDKVQYLTESAELIAARLKDVIATQQRLGKRGYGRLLVSYHAVSFGES